MRTIAGLLALGIALLRPPSDSLVPLCGPSSADWLPALERFWWRRQPQVAPAVESNAPAHELAGCDCPCAACPCAAPRLEVSDAARCFAAGLAIWPALDVLWLVKLAWQRRVAALARALQVRPPDRP